MVRECQWKLKSEIHDERASTVPAAAAASRIKKGCSACAYTYTQRARPPLGTVTGERRVPRGMTKHTRASFQPIELIVNKCQIRVREVRKIQAYTLGLLRSFSVRPRFTLECILYGEGSSRLMVNRTCVCVYGKWSINHHCWEKWTKEMRCRIYVVWKWRSVGDYSKLNIHGLFII